MVIGGIMLSVLCGLSGAQEAEALRINLDVKNMSITDVLRLLAEQGQVNIVASRNVQGRVTAKLLDVTVDQALNAILDANNFTYKKENGIIKVYTQQDVLQQEQTERLVSRVFLLNNIKATDMRQVLNSIKSSRGRVEVNTISNQVVVTDTEDAVIDMERAIKVLDRAITTRIYTLNYGTAKDIQTKLLEIIPKGEGDVFVDERTNTLVVRAMPETIQKIDQMITSWDRRSAQVLIEAKIMEVSLDKTQGLGVNWEYLSTTGKNAVDATATLPANISNGGILKIGTLTADQYQVTIQALESSTNTNVLSNPRIVVVDNNEANILVGSSEPYLITYIDKETNTQTEETKFIDVGVKLKVTPKISEDDFVTLKIHPEVSSARRVTEVNNSLAVDTTQADTTVVVKDGKTIVLGGLIKDTDTKVVTKVPILGSIPVLGLMFRGTAKTKTKKEIIVFITPHILKQEVKIEELRGRNQAMNDALQEALRKWQEWEGKVDDRQ
ncbi:MAG: secretin N-terminal domain-containing protein [Candidatus Omnitrophica bacterium]|nr:secretin N-terminal domain-containing protein [Candidatus Omnitrophota bacterium]